MGLTSRASLSAHSRSMSSVKASFLEALCQNYEVREPSLVRRSSQQVNAKSGSEVRAGMRPAMLKRTSGGRVRMLRPA